MRVFDLFSDMDATQIIFERNFSLWNFGAAISDEQRAVDAAKTWVLIRARPARCRKCRARMSNDIKPSSKLGSLALLALLKSWSNQHSISIKENVF